MVDVKTIIEESQEKMDMAVMYLEEALAHIRAGKASTRLLDGIRVDSYGSMVPISNPAVMAQKTLSVATRIVATKAPITPWYAPMEISIPPSKITVIMPIAAIPAWDVCRRSVIILDLLAKLGAVTEKNTQRRTRSKSMINWSS